MPLLHRKKFIKKKPDRNLRPDEKVFFCELTEEVFTDYDEFWERLVLLNALVWTCELTGRPNLTYQEALECEDKARKCISSVSLALKKPLLYISTYTRRGRIADASDDIFNYIRDRYFVGEEVEAIVSNHWYDCKVTKVIMPTQQEIIEYEQALEDSDEDSDDDDDEPVIVNGHPEDGDDDIFIIRDDHQKKPLPKPEKEEKKKAKKEEEKEYPPFPAVKYEVVEIEAWDYKEPKHHIVSWDQIRRSKSAFTREKCKLFVKQFMTISPGGYWAVKDSIAEKYGIRQMKYSDIFVGNPPRFEETKMKKLPFHATVIPKKEKSSEKTKNKVVKQREEKEKRPETKKKEENKKKEDHKKKEDNKKKDETKKKGKPLMTEEAREAAKRQQLELKEKSKEIFRKKLEQMKIERKRKKELLKEETRLMKVFESDWWQKKEDLECEDNKDLPASVPLKTRIPDAYFGDFMMLLDFVNTFASLLELGDVYPNGITYEMLERALIERELAGVFNDVIQLLLGAIFSLQEEEDEEAEGDTTMDLASMNLEEHLESKSQKAAVSVANKASTWSQQYQGVSLQKLPLDALTLTEVLRLHILASGATSVANELWRHVNRGGYKHTDDPGLQFKLDEPEVIKRLGTECLFDLSIEEKLKILNVLVAQILTYASVRDSIEEKVEKLREVSYQYKNYKWASIRKEKEEMVAKRQRLKDLRLKMEKKLLDQRLQTAGDSPTEAAKAKIIITEELEEEEGEKEKETRSTAKKREDSEKQERDFVEQIESLSRDVRNFQLGQDRAFRRYWLFNNIPGLFIEDMSQNLGGCLDHPTPVESVILPQDNAELKDVIKRQAIRNMEIMNKEKENENEKSTSDKENESGETPTKNEIKMPFSEKNLLKTPNSNIINQNNTADLSSSVKEESEASKEYSPKAVEEEEEEIVDLVSLPPKEPSDDVNTEELHAKIFGLCSSNKETCPAHSGNHSRPRWSYYNSTEDFEKLLESLNVRGMREGELKENLLLHKDKIVSSLEGVKSFAFDCTPTGDDTNDSKKALKRNLNFPQGTPLDHILKVTLRDMVLETEEKIDNGMLGRLKVPERDVWRIALSEGTSLSFSNTQDLDWGGKKRINQFKSVLGMETTEEEVGDMEELVSKDGLTQAGVIKELAIAILQVGQALDSKYLKAPLVESEKSSRKRRKLEERLRKQSKKNKKDSEANNEDSSSDEEEETQEKKGSADLLKNVDNSLRTPFERWEKSLMACTSFSQLFLHLATLDNSITWSRSAVVNKRCRVCRRSSDPDNMLLCDECDGGYHMFCLKPVLKSIPDGDWFCDRCKPKVKPKTPKKQRHIYKEESEEELEEDASGEEQEEEDVEDEEEEEEETEEGFINQEFCNACEMGGELICCDTCPRSFHLDCADLRKVPRGNWSCPLCKEEKSSPSSSKRKAKSGKSTSKSNNKKLKTDNEIENALRRTSRTPRPIDESFDDIYDRGKRGIKRDIDEMENGEFHRDTVEMLIENLTRHSDSGPFRKPVIKQEVPDYYTKIKKPMDLRTIRRRFNNNKYTTDAEFIADVLLIFQNTQQYYKEDDPIYKAGLKISKFFLNKVRKSGLQSAGQIEETYERPNKRKRQM